MISDENITKNNSSEWPYDDLGREGHFLEIQH